jgi:hypothetical protein
MNMYKWMLVGFSLLLVACQNEEKLTKKKYFDLSGHIAELSKNSKSLKVKKTWQLNRHKDEKVVSLTNLQQELALFEEADLNKKAYKLSYNKIEKVGSTRYELKANENLLVKWIEIKWDSDRNAEQIVIFETEDNYLYTIKQTLFVSTKNRKLSRYRIENEQKIVFTKPSVSIVEGQVL